MQANIRKDLVDPIKNPSAPLLSPPFNSPPLVINLPPALETPALEFRTNYTTQCHSPRPPQHLKANTHTVHPHVPHKAVPVLVSPIPNSKN